jgi:branched-chain amino acid transport system substrate-binding protein
MIHRSCVRASILIFALGLVFAGCGGSAGPQTSQTNNTNNAGGTILIGFDGAVKNSPDGLNAERGVTIAVKANSNLGNGYTLDVVDKDDSTPDGLNISTDIGMQNVKDFIANPQVIAVVGPGNSGIAQYNMPLLQAAGLPTIGTTPTTPWLTKREFAAAANVDFDKMHPANMPNSFFRWISTTELQGQAIAYLATQPATSGGYSAHTAYVIDDGTDYGTGLATLFTTSFTQMKGTSLGHQTTKAPVASDAISSLVADIVAKHPDIVVIAGTDAIGAGDIKHAMYDAGLTQTPVFVGNGDALKASMVQHATNAGAVGTTGTLPAPDVSMMTTTDDMNFIAAYQAAFPGEKASPYAFIAYDCAMIEITVIKQLIQSGKPVTRSNVRDGIAKIQYKGLTGTISFDANGDNSGPKAISVYSVTDTSGTWRFMRSISEADMKK